MLIKKLNFLVALVIIYIFLADCIHASSNFVLKNVASEEKKKLGVAKKNDQVKLEDAKQKENKMVKILAKHEDIPEIVDGDSDGKDRSSSNVINFIGDSDDEDEDDEEQCDKSRQMVAYYNFDMAKMKAKRVIDQSGCDNHGILESGILIARESKSTCGAVAFLWNKDVKIPASSFQNPPKSGITVAMYMKLEGKRRARSVFSVSGPHFGTLALDILAPIISWSYKNSAGTDLFRTHALSNATVDKNKQTGGWFHLAAVFNAEKGVAQVFVNGEPINRTLSTVNGPFKYWGNDVKIGASSDNKPLEAFIDDFRIYNYAVPASTIQSLANTCQFTRNKNNVFSNNRHRHHRHRLHSKLGGGGGFNNFNF